MGLDVSTEDLGSAAGGALLLVGALSALAVGLVKGIGGHVDLIDSHVFWTEHEGEAETSWWGGQAYDVTIVQDAIPGDDGHLLPPQVEQRVIGAVEFEAALAIATSTTGDGPPGSDARKLYEHAERAMGRLRWIP